MTLNDPFYDRESLFYENSIKNQEDNLKKYVDRYWKINKVSGWLERKYKNTNCSIAFQATIEKQYNVFICAAYWSYSESFSTVEECKKIVKEFDFAAANKKADKLDRDRLIASLSPRQRKLLRLK